MVAPDGAGLDELVEVIPSDPAWPAQFEAERERILQASGNGIVAIEHFGSTAVPGLAAKPIVDLLVGVDAWQPAGGLRQRLVNLGYEDIGEAGVPGRIYLRWRGPRAFNVALVAHGGLLWTDNLNVRDLLRRDPRLRAEYEAAKSAALAAGGTRLLAYSAHKAEFLRGLLELCRETVTG